MTPAQAKAARQALDWTASALARKVGISVATITNFESGTHRTNNLIVSQIKRVLEAEGVSFHQGKMPAQPTSKIVRIELDDGTSITIDR